MMNDFQKTYSDLDSPVVTWLLTEAKLKLNQSMQKLNLDSTKITGKHLISYTIDELLQEKKKVKNELKIYD